MSSENKALSSHLSHSNPPHPGPSRIHTERNRLIVPACRQTHTHKHKHILHSVAKDCPEIRNQTTEEQSKPDYLQMFMNSRYGRNHLWRLQTHTYFFITDMDLSVDRLCGYASYRQTGSGITVLHRGFGSGKGHTAAGILSLTYFVFFWL